MTNTSRFSKLFQMYGEHVIRKWFREQTESGQIKEAKMEKNVTKKLIVKAEIARNPAGIPRRFYSFHKAVKKNQVKGMPVTYQWYFEKYEIDRAVPDPILVRHGTYPYNWE